VAGTKLTKNALALDLAAETDKICNAIRGWMRQLNRRGAVVGLSAGIDSSVVGALCVRALGKERTFGLLMPERDSSQETRRLSDMLVKHFGIDHALEELTPILDAARCYERRDEALRKVLPEYEPSWKSKIVLPSVVDSDQFRVFSAVVQKPDGTTVKVRLNTEAYLGIVAATNFKQRTRTMLEYYHADRLNFAVAGTPNLLEYDQGFFVKGGDGLADFKPIAHLYKTQVYALAGHLGLPPEIQARLPTTDTYSLAQSQEEFYFSLPYAEMDLALWAYDHHVTPEDAAPALGITPEQVGRIYRDIEGKRAFARYLHAAPLTFFEAH